MNNDFTKIIPKEWQIKKVKDVCELGRGRVISKNEIRGNLGNFPVYSSQSMNNGEMGRLKTFDFDGEYVTWTTDGAYAGTVFYRNEKFNCTNVCGTLKARVDNLNMKFLSLALSCIAEKYVVKTGNPKLMNNIMAEIPVLLPPIKEQNKIAEILSCVDEEIEKVDQEIKKTEELKRGLMAELLTKGIGHKKFKKIKIKEISEVTSSKRVMVSDYVNEGIPFYRSTEIIKKSKNLPIINSLHIPLEKFNFFKDRFGAPEKGDLLVTAVGTIGDVYMVQDEIFYFKDGNSIWIRKIKDYILPEYLRVILGSNFYREKLNNIAGGSSQKALTIQKLGNVEIPISSITEQKKITEILSEVDNKININKQIKNKLAELKRGLMQDLLSGRVRTVV